MALDSARLFVVDGQQTRVQVFSIADGAPLRLIVPPYASPIRGLCVGEGRMLISTISDKFGPRIISLDLAEAFAEAQSEAQPDGHK